MSNTTTTTRTRRPRPKLVTLTDAAAERVREILDERGEGYLRVGVTNGGCAGMEYVMGLSKIKTCRLLWMPRPYSLFWAQSWITKSM